MHLKRWPIMYLFHTNPPLQKTKQIKTCQISPFTQHCHGGRQPSHTMVLKCVEWIILLLIEEDQNKSSANLFSGLRSGVWCNETQLSYLLYHSKNTPGDFDNWIAVKWYPFTISLNIYESARSFSEKGNKKKKKRKSVTSRCHATILDGKP